MEIMGNMNNKLHFENEKVDRILRGLLKDVDASVLDALKTVLVANSLLLNFIEKKQMIDEFKNSLDFLEGTVIKKSTSLLCILQEKIEKEKIFD